MNYFRAVRKENLKYLRAHSNKSQITNTESFIICWLNCFHHASRRMSLNKQIDDISIQQPQTKLWCAVHQNHFVTPMHAKNSSMLTLPSWSWSTCFISNIWKTVLLGRFICYNSLKFCLTQRLAFRRQELSEFLDIQHSIPINIKILERTFDTFVIIFRSQELYKLNDTMVVFFFLYLQVLKEWQ